jgi:hypothetical protein
LALKNLLPDDICQRVSIRHRHHKYPVPDWAASLVWLGGWTRSNSFADNRLIVVVVLPTRELAAAFAAFGCLIAGASAFEDALSWPTFKNLPTGREVYWSRRDGTERYRGKILGVEERGNSEFISLCISRAPRRNVVGTTLQINRRNFEGYRFTEEAPPTKARTVLLNAAMQALAPLVENLNPKWIWADGAEGLLVTGVVTFENSIEGLALSIGEQGPIAISDLLCSGRNKDQSHSKLRIDHPRGTLSGDFPVAILDGPSAFMIHEHLGNVPNLLVILDRTEYKQDVHDALLSLRSISCDNLDNRLQESIPSAFPAGVEVAAYLIDRQ